MKIVRTVSLAVIALSVLLIGCATGALEVQDVWARPGVEGGNGAVYFIIDNGNADDYNLLSANSDIAEAVEIHRSIMENDVMRMEQQDSVPVPANSAVAFEPGGLHVMLIGLSGDLNVGDTFDLVLSFEDAGEIELNVPVKAP